MKKKTTTKTTGPRKLVLEKSNIRVIQSCLTEDQLQAVAGGQTCISTIRGTCI